MRVTWAILLLSVCHSFAQAPDPSAPPTAPTDVAVLICPDMTIDFGSADHTTSFKHSFLIRNEGTAPLRINSLHSTCGCSLFKVRQETIPPEGQTYLDVELDLKGRRGPQEFPLFIRSNTDPDGLTRLMVKGTVTHAIDVTPPAIFLTRLPLGEPTTRALTVKTGDGKPFKTTGIRTEASFFGIETNAISATNVLLQAHIAAQSTLGLLRGAVIVETDRPGYETVRIPVAVHVHGPVLCIPSEVTLVGPGTQARFSLRTRDGTGLESAEVVSAPETVQVTLTPARRSSYVGRIIPQADPKTLSGAVIRLKVKTKAGETYQVRLPLRAM